MSIKQIADNVRSLNRRWQRLCDHGQPGSMETHSVMLDIQDAYPIMRKLTDNPMGHVKQRFHHGLSQRKPGGFLWVLEVRAMGMAAEPPTIATKARGR